MGGLWLNSITACWRSFRKTPGGTLAPLRVYAAGLRASWCVNTAAHAAARRSSACCRHLACPLPVTFTHLPLLLRMPLTALTTLPSAVVDGFIWDHSFCASLPTLCLGVWVVPSSTARVASGGSRFTRTYLLPITRGVLLVAWLPAFLPLLSV